MKRTLQAPVIIVEKEHTMVKKLKCSTVRTDVSLCTLNRVRLAAQWRSTMQDARRQCMSVLRGAYNIDVLRLLTGVVLILLLTACNRTSNNDDGDVQVVERPAILCPVVASEERGASRKAPDTGTVAGAAMAFNATDEFEQRIRAQLRLDELLKCSDQLLQTNGAVLCAADVDTLTQAVHWCEIRFGPRVIQLLLRCGMVTSAFEVIETLSARLRPEQSGYRSTFDIEKARILDRWNATDQAVAILLDVVQRDAHLKDTWNGSLVEAHLLLADIKSSQGLYAEAEQHYCSILECRLDAETRRFIEQDRRAVLESWKDQHR